jgi:hypothetical protein
VSGLYEKPLDAAIMYAVMGWRTVPGRPGSKVPIINDWVNAASTDEATIRAWWDQYPDAGVCIVTGRETGLWVLDVDVADGKEGLESLRKLIEENGGEKLPETLVARTPSGGYHYYFAYPDDAEIHNSASNHLGPGLDVRGEGGQVVAPPTTRGENCYRWADGRAPWSAEALPAPGWLLSLVKDTEKPLITDEVIKGSLPVMDIAAAKRVKEGVNLLGGVPEFVTRYNDEHTWEQLLTEAGWTLANTDDKGVTYWCRPGKTKREGISASTNYAGSDLLYVWTTSLEWLESDRAYDKYGFTVRREHRGDFDAAAAHFVGLERRQEAVGADLRLLPQPDATEDNTEEETELSRLEQAEIRLDSDAFWDADTQDSQFLIEPFLAVGRGHALFAEAKAGKSYVVLQALAAAAVPGHKSWAEVPEEPITILYLDYEMTEDDLRERLEIFGYTRHDDYSRFHYVKASMLGAGLDTYAGGIELLAQAQKWRCDLVVIDTMSRAVSGGENEADTVNQFYQHTGRLLKANGIAWLRIDHAGKNLDRGQRGSSAKDGDVDVVWRLERTDDGALLSLTHSRVFWMDQRVSLANREAGEEGGIVHIRAAHEGYPSGVHEKAQLWLELGVPLDASRRAAKAMGFECRANLFSHVKRFVNEEAERHELLSMGRGSLRPGNH